MQFHRVTVETCEHATGVVIVIDVLRAFSTAAYAFAAGASETHLVSTVEEAFTLKQKYPAALLMGEVHGLPIEGFDYGNSPTALQGEKLSGRHFIQRTSTGTQGAVRSINATELLASSFCNAKSTAAFIQRLQPNSVTFVICGEQSGVGGDEDKACADYIELLLRGDTPDIEHYLERVQTSSAAQKFLNPKMLAFPISDLEYCMNVNIFDFVMVVSRTDDLLTLRPLS